MDEITFGLDPGVSQFIGGLGNALGSIPGALAGGMNGGASYGMGAFPTSSYQTMPNGAPQASSGMGFGPMLFFALVILLLILFLR